MEVAARTVTCDLACGVSSRERLGIPTIEGEMIETKETKPVQFRPTSSLYEKPMIIEEQFAFYLLISGASLLFVSACLMLKNEIRKYNKRVARHNKVINENETFKNHYRLINEKLPRVTNSNSTIIPIKAETFLKEEKKNIISLKFPANKKQKAIHESSDFESQTFKKQQRR